MEHVCTHTHTHNNPHTSSRGDPHRFPPPRCWWTAGAGADECRFSDQVQCYQLAVLEVPPTILAKPMVQLSRVWPKTLDEEDKVKLPPSQKLVQAKLKSKSNEYFNPNIYNNIYIRQERRIITANFKA